MKSINEEWIEQLLLGPEQGTCKLPIVFPITFFYLVPNDHIFHCLNMDENEILFGKNIRLGKKYYNLWSSWMSTTRCCYNQGKCVLPYIVSHILDCTFKNLISTCSLNCLESCDIGHGHFYLTFFFVMKDVVKGLYTAPWNIKNSSPASYIHNNEWHSLCICIKTRRTKNINNIEKLSKAFAYIKHGGCHGVVTFHASPWSIKSL